MPPCRRRSAAHSRRGACGSGAIFVATLRPCWERSWLAIYATRIFACPVVGDGTRPARVAADARIAWRGPGEPENPKQDRRERVLNPRNENLLGEPRQVGRPFASLDFSWAEVFCEPVFEGHEKSGLKKTAPSNDVDRKCRTEGCGRRRFASGNCLYSLGVLQCCFQKARFSY